MRQEIARKAQPGYSAGMRVDPRIQACVDRMRQRAVDRDGAMQRVLAIRRGRFAEVWPDYFSDRIPTSIVANYVDVTARDLAASVAPLPTLACSAGAMNSDADVRRAERKNRIGTYYWRCSSLQTQMKYGADQYLTYGFMPMWVEPDYERNMPVIHIDDPVGTYYELDRWFCVRRYVHTWKADRYELCSFFPEYENRILRDEYGYERESQMTDVVRYIDENIVMIWLPEMGDLVVASYYHMMPSAPVVIALRPGVEIDPRGQFDDVLWVQLAKTMMASLMMEAGEKAVQAPIVAPSDVNRLPIGPDALLITDSPQGVGRVPFQIPNDAFMLEQQLTTELSTGAGYPDARLGAAPPGGTTGRGV